MRNIFELTKRERRVVIVIVTLLVAIAFAKHAWQNKSSPPVKTSAPEATAPSRHEENESSDDSRD
jgi:predicted metal-binding membrane protein